MSGHRRWAIVRRSRPAPDVDIAVAEELLRLRRETLDVALTAPEEALALLVHELHCGDAVPCRRWQAHESHRNWYAERATNIYRQLEPEIGASNVILAVKAILEEME